MTEIEQIISALLHDLHGSEDLPAVTPNSEFSADLGMDDLDVLEIITFAERKFDIEICDYEITCKSTVGDIYDLIARRLETKRILDAVK